MLMQVIFIGSTRRVSLDCIYPFSPPRGPAKQTATRVGLICRVVDRLAGGTVGRSKSMRPARPMIFVSHAHEEKSIAGKLKESLDRCGVTSFLAHYDIVTGDKWDMEILDELSECDVFLIILTDNSRNSQYVNQEIGFALARGTPIIPLKAPIDPWCFISNIQGMEFKTKHVPTKSGLTEVYDYHDTAIAIVENLMNRPGLLDRIKENLLQGLKSSPNVVETAAKARLLKLCNEFTEGEVRSIVTAALSNEHVSRSFATPALIKKLHEEYPRLFDDQSLIALKEKGLL